MSAVWSLNLRDPHLLPIRNYETWIIAGLVSVAFIISLGIKNICVRRILQLIAICLGAYVISSEYNFQTHKKRLLNHPTNAERVINQRLIIGFTNIEEIEKLVQNGIAGIFITKRNIENTIYDELRLRIEKLQQLRTYAELPKLFVSTDQEGGEVSRLSPLVEQQPSLSTLTTKKGATNLAFEYGKKQGAQLYKLGINVNFSPVVDIKPANKSGVLDFHTMIHTRAISDNAQEIIKIARPYIDGLNTAGVTATLKHFPGLSRVNNDTHHFSAELKTNISELVGTDWLPFSKLSRKTDSWIMLAHVVLVDVDPLNPVSTSPIVVKKILRDKLNFKGVIITDDLTMGATYNRGFCKSVRNAYSSDINYLLIAYDSEKYYELMNCLSMTEKD